MIEDVQRNGFRGSGKEVVLRKGREVERCGGGVRMWQDGGGIICYNKEVV
jgi:hypothetical protein